MEEESPLNPIEAPSFSEITPNPIPSNVERIELTTEQLIAKAIAPVKKEFLLPPPPPSRHCSTTNGTDSVGGVDDDASEKKLVSSSSNLLKERKSKRQFKRDRLEEQKSALQICGAVAKTGDVNSCPYKNNCRLSHDIEAFKAKNPADLEGKCPFLDIEGPCPYGLACRYFGTHKDDVSDGSLNGMKKGSEVNGLSKDVQRLLWKDKMLYPKSDATLKLLGLADKTYKKKKITQDDQEANLTNSNEPCANDENGEKVVNASANVEEPSPKALEVKNIAKEDQEANLTISDGSQANDQNGTKLVNESANIEEPSPKVSEVEDSLDGTVLNDDDRPSKKAKPAIDGNCCNIEAVPLDVEKSSTQNVADDILTETDASLKLHLREKKLIDFRDKLYLAPLTTVGNLPFRRVCKVLGADVTCGEMAMCTNLLQGQASEWALLRRHESEDMFGVQICGTYADNVARAVELIDRECTVDFIDINMGCPIDIVVNKGAGSALLTKPLRMKHAVEAASRVAGETPITVKVRTGYIQGINRVETFIQDIGRWGASALTIHGRSRQQRYSKLADWDYITKCAKQAPKDLQVLGNGDIFSYLDWNQHKSDCPELSTCMIARGALVKPWIFTEIKEQRHWDISSGERLNIFKDYVRFGLQHWGSDTKGVETTRHFLLEWLSYTYRYVPVGLLEVIPSQLNWRPPSYFGRDDLETLMASESAADWVRITELLLGKVPEGFKFAPKHKSNAYDKAENG